jgi:hypothetical protein
MRRQAVDPIANAPCATEVLNLFEHILRRGTMLRVRVSGRSMKPFLKGEEILTIRSVASSSLRKGDLIFFKSREGCPVVHRIVKKGKNGNEGITFQTKGDALTVPDEPVRDEDILGKVCRVESGPRCVDLERGIWSAVNYLAAAVSVFEARLRVAARKVMHSARAGKISGKGNP